MESVGFSVVDERVVRFVDVMSDVGSDLLVVISCVVNLVDPFEVSDSDVIASALVVGGIVVVEVVELFTEVSVPVDDVVTDSLVEVALVEVFPVDCVVLSSVEVC